MPRITTSLEGINRNLSTVFLTGKHDVFPYASGKRISEIKTATKFTGVLPGNCLTPLSVKIEGATDPLPDISNEKIAEACATMKFIFVRFTDCMVSLYNMNGQLGMTATAHGVSLVSGNK